MKLVERLGGLRIKEDVAGEIEAVNVVKLLDDDGRAMGLSHQPQHLGMAVLAEDDNLRTTLPQPIGDRLGRLKLPLDAPLQLQHHRTSGIYNVNMVATSKFVGLGRLSMGTQQHFHPMQTGKLLMVDGDETLRGQTFHLHTVVYDVAQTIERFALGKLFFGFLDGCGHAEAETTAVVYFYL